VPAQFEKERGRSDLVLVNPCAGAGRGATALLRVKEFSRRVSWDVSFVLTACVDDLSAQVRAAVAAGRPRIFILGGDGTVQHVVNALGAGSSVALGVIPGGGGNDLAAALGLPMDAVEAAELLLRAEPCPMDVVRVRTCDGSERFYVGGGGVGLDAAASHYASGVYRQLPGRLRYFLSAIHAWLGHGDIEVRVRAESDAVPSAYPSSLLVSVLNTPSFGAGIRLAPDAQVSDGELDLAILGNLSAWGVLTLLPALLLRGDVRTNRIHRQRIKRVRIETAKACMFHGDGEDLGMTPVDIEVVPGAIQVLRPQKSS
jgi:diacylglycerol kinase (ATP)